jgi:hypothetical protein
MSLAVFENFLKFAEGAVAVKAKWPPEVDINELESAFVNYGVVLLHSHMEQCFRMALEVRCARCADLEVLAFALSVKDEKTGKIGLDSVKATLRRFSAAYRTTFDAELKKSGLEDAWGSIQAQRHRVAHYGEPATLTLAELRGYYEDIRKVLGYFCKGLSLTHLEVAKISSLIIV